MVLVERTKIYFIPTCAICGVEARSCFICDKEFNVNPNDDQYDGLVICVRLINDHRRWKNPRMIRHVCSEKCLNTLMIELKEEKYEKSNILVHDQLEEGF
jgi:hypothetical protein